MRTNSIKAENKQAKPAIQSSQLVIKIKKKKHFNCTKYHILKQTISIQNPEVLKHFKTKFLEKF